MPARVSRFPGTALGKLRDIRAARYRSCYGLARRAAIGEKVTRVVRVVARLNVHIEPAARRQQQ